MAIHVTQQAFYDTQSQACAAIVSRYRFISLGKAIEDEACLLGSDADTGIHYSPLNYTFVVLGSETSKLNVY